MLKKLLLFIILSGLLISGYIYSSGSFQGVPVNAISIDKYDNRMNNPGYLSTFDNLKLNRTANEISFSGSKKLTDINEEYLELSKDNKDISELNLEFSIQYIKLINLVFIDVSLVDSKGETVQHTKLYASPEIGKSGKLDLNFYHHGETFYASDIFSTDDSEQISKTDIEPKSMVTLPPGGGGTVTFYPLIIVTYSIVGMEDSISEASNITTPPTLFADGPIACILYEAKLALIQANYNHNSSISPVTGFIDNQTLLSNWKYGFSNMVNAGCEIVALYNFLYQTNYSGENVDLASLIALTQLINADFGLGLLGSNPSSDFSSFVSDSLQSEIEYLITTYVIGTDLISIYSNYIVEQYYDLPSWLQSIYSIIINTTTSIINGILNEIVIGACSDAIDYFMSVKHNFIEVITLFGISNNVNYDNLIDLNNHLDDSGYFIISYWNELNSDGSPNIFGQLHTIYIYRHSDTEDFIAHNISQSYDYENELYVFIDANITIASSMFISGNVINS